MERAHHGLRERGQHIKADPNELIVVVGMCGWALCTLRGNGGACVVVLCYAMPLKMHLTI